MAQPALCSAHPLFGHDREAQERNEQEDHECQEQQSDEHAHAVTLRRSAAAPRSALVFGIPSQRAVHPGDDALDELKALLLDFAAATLRAITPCRLTHHLNSFCAKW